MIHTRSLLLTITLLTLISTQAPAWEKRGHYATGKGQSGTFSTEGKARKGAWSKHSTVKTGTGKTATRSVEGSYDKDTRTINRTVNGWNGQTHTTTSTYDPATGAFTAKATGANGKSVTATGTAGDGQREGTYTTSGGRTGSFRSKLIKNSDGSYTRNGSVTTEKGKTYNNSNTSSYDQETRTLKDTYTGYNGDTHSGSVTIDATDTDAPR